MSQRPPQQGQGGSPSVFNAAELLEYRSALLELFREAERVGLRSDDYRIRTTMTEDVAETMRQIHAVTLSYHFQHQWSEVRQGTPRGVFDLPQNGHGGNGDEVPLWDEVVYRLDVDRPGEGDDLPDPEISLSTVDDWSSVEIAVQREETDMYGNATTVEDTERLFLPYGAAQALFRQYEAVHSKTGLGPDLPEQQLQRR